MFKRFLFVLVLLVLFSSNAFADEQTVAQPEGKEQTVTEPEKKEDDVTKPEKKEKDVIKLEEIVVTATRTAKPVETAPGTVNVVTKKEIETRNTTTVDEALNTLPGVYNQRQSLTDIEASVTLNGIPDQKRTLIMMDGIPLNDAYDGTVSFSALSTENVEKVEVVQGPFSSLYGGNAMGGVVNIITKMPEKREFTFISGYGSAWDRGQALDDFQKYYISYGDKPTEKISLLVSYGYKATNGYPSNFNVQSAPPVPPPAGIKGWLPTTDNGQYGGLPAYIIGDTGDNAWWDDNFCLKGRFDFTPDSKLSVSFMRMRYKYSYDDPHAYLKDASGNPVYEYGPPSSGSNYTVNQSTFDYGSGGKEVNMYSMGYETEIGIVKAKLTLGLTDEGKNWYVSPGYLDSTTLTGGPGQVTSTPSQNYIADLLFTLPIFSRNILTFGGSFKTDWANSQTNNLTNWQDETSTADLVSNSGGKDRTFAVFVQDEILILSNLTAYIGFREDWWETYDGYANQFGAGGFADTYDSRSASSFSPKASIVYKPFEITTLRTDIGQAFRGPTVYELYSKWSYFGTIWNSNPDLKPETTTSWDVGIEQGLWKGAKVSATYFDNQIQDMIYSMQVSPTEVDKVNVGKAESKGIRLAIEQRFDKWLRLFANYTYTDARIKENSADPLSVGKRMTFLPDTMINTGAEYEIGPFQASVTGRYVSKIYSDDQNRDTINGVYTSYDPYFTADAKVSYKVTKFATLSACVNNIFNESYFIYYKAPGRSWFGQMEIKF